MEEALLTTREKPSSDAGKLPSSDRVTAKKLVVARVPSRATTKKLVVARVPPALLLFSTRATTNEIVVARL